MPDTALAPAELTDSIARRVRPRLYELRRTPWMVSLQSQARDRASGTRDFVEASDRIIRLLLEAALDLVPYQAKTVWTPTGMQFDGNEPLGRICAVPVIRAGESMESSLRHLLPGVAVGKILIQRDTESLQPRFFYSKFPPEISEHTVLLLEPMLATAGSLLTAIRCLLDAGVREESIISVNVLASPAGIERVMAEHPGVRLVVSSIEDGLTERGYMCPGIGDFGDRYFGTATR